MKLKIDINKDSGSVYYLRFESFEDLQPAFKKIVLWRVRTMEKMKKMLRFLEIPYTVIGPFEIDIEEGALNEKNKAWFEERLNNEFNKFSTQKGIAKRKISDFKHDTSGNIRGKASK